MSVLCLALIMHPEVQRKAQMEIDTVIGTERLPNAGDIERLPYLQAMLKENARWHTVAPLCRQSAPFSRRRPAKLLLYSSPACHRWRRYLQRVPHPCKYCRTIECMVCAFP